MGLVTELIQRNAWEQLELLLLNERLISELFVVDRLGRTPLHYACAKKQAPESVVLLMLEKCRKWCLSRDICGNTPLHAAAANGNATIVKLLLQHLNTMRIQYVNDVGSTPLLMAWKKYLSPSSTLFGHVHSVGRLSPKVSSENIRLLSSIQHVSQLKDIRFAHLQDVWTKTLVLVARAKQSVMRPLFDLLSVGSKRHVQCPTVAYWLAIRLFASGEIHQRDACGNLPIHLAAQHANLAVIPMASIPNDFLEKQENELSVLDATESALTQLAKRYPKGAMTPDRQGRLPIHLAIESGKQYEQGIHALVQAAPQTLEQGDVKTGLPPFLLAATSPKASLTLVWELVRARPDLILNSMTSSTLLLKVGGKRPATVQPEKEVCVKKVKISLR
jgi:ankyrin repeat protein